jgi:hypothetical protein
MLGGPRRESAPEGTTPNVVEKENGSMETTMPEDDLPF